MREDRDAQVVHGNDIWRGSGCAGAFTCAAENGCKGRVVVRKDDTDAESSHDEKDAETPINGLESSLDVNAWALGFGSHHSDILGSNHCEGC